MELNGKIGFMSPSPTFKFSCYSSGRSKWKPLAIKDFGDYCIPLIDQGIVDYRFEMLQSIQEQLSDRTVSDTVNTFFNAMGRGLKTLSNHIQGGMLSNQDMRILLFKMKGQTSCIGATKVHNALSEMQQAMKNNDRNGAIHALYSVQNEYACVKPKLERLLERVVDATLVHGKQWELIAQMLHKRTDNDVKDKWHSTLQDRCIATTGQTIRSSH